MSPSGRELARAGALLAGLALLAAGCGIPLSPAAELSRTPPNLYSQVPKGTTPTTVPNTTKHVRIGIYFLNASETRLVETVALVEPPATPAGALDLLTYGPTAADFEAGYSTALSVQPQATVGVRVNKRTGVATVALDNTFNNLFGTPLYDALAQIVYTLTDPGLGVRAVQFTQDDIAYPAELPSGSFAYRPVTRADYASLAPLPRPRPPGHLPARP
jgi:hypothetical protein